MNIFKLFSGEQDGSEITLNINETITVGNNISCDIYLATSQLAEATFKLNLTDQDHVQFDLNEQLKFWDNSQIDTDTTYQLPIFFNFDTLKIAIGEPSQITKWPAAILNQAEEPDLDLADVDLNNLELAEEVDTLSHAVESEIIPSKVKILWDALQKRLEPFNTYVNQKYSWASKVIYISGGTLLLLITVIIISAGLSVHQENKIQQWLLLEAALKTSFNQLPSNAMSLSLVKVRDKQEFVIQGLIYSNKESLLIQRNLARFKPILSYSLMTVPQAIGKIQTILAAHAMSNLKVRYESDTQNISVNGVENSSANAINDTEIDINNQLTNVSDIIFNIYEASQVKTDFDHYLGSISDLVDITDNLANDTLTVNGYLTAKQLTSYNAAVDQFNSKYHGIITINSQIKDAISALPFKIYGVFVGNPSYIITDQGDTVFIGGLIGKFRLTAVTDSKITLNNDDYNLEIPLSQISNQQITPGLNDQKRDTILAEELNKNQQILKDEQAQITELKKYQPTAESSAKFIQQQVRNLETDIKAKVKDVHALEGILNAP